MLICVFILFVSSPQLKQEEELLPETVDNIVWDLMSPVKFSREHYLACSAPDVEQFWGPTRLLREQTVLT